MIRRPLLRESTVSEAARRWDVSRQRIHQWLAAARIGGARQVGGLWLIPAGARPPKPIRR